MRNSNNTIETQTRDFPACRTGFIQSLNFGCRDKNSIFATPWLAKCHFKFSVTSPCDHKWHCIHTPFCFRYHLCRTKGRVSNEGSLDNGHSTLKVGTTMLSRNVTTDHPATRAIFKTKPTQHRVKFCTLAYFNSHNLYLSSRLWWLW